MAQIRYKIEYMAQIRYKDITLILLQPMNYDFNVMFSSNSLQIRPTVAHERHIYLLCYGCVISVTDVTNMGMGIWSKIINNT